MTAEIPKDGYVIILGAMRAGTTSLYAYMSKHPEICPAVAKEPGYFTERFRRPIAMDRYEDLWPSFSRQHRYAMEASTGYAKYPMEPGLPERIRDYGIAPRFIYIVRNPFDRIRSHRDFLGTVRDIWHPLTHEHLINTSRYHMQLEQFCRVFPRDHILVLDFEELATNPQATLKTVYGFLGISEERLPTKYDVKNAAGNLRPGGQGILRRLVWVLSNRWKRLTGLGPSPVRSAWTDAEKQFVHDALADDMARLKKDYGINVEKWGFGL